MAWRAAKANDLLRRLSKKASVSTIGVNEGRFDFRLGEGVESNLLVASTVC
jgi:hypothetical protein